MKLNDLDRPSRRYRIAMGIYLALAVVFGLIILWQYREIRSIAQDANELLHTNTSLVNLLSEKLDSMAAVQRRLDRALSESVEALMSGGPRSYRDRMRRIRP